MTYRLMKDPLRKDQKVLNRRKKHSSHKIPKVYVIEETKIFSKYCQKTSKNRLKKDQKVC